MWGVYEAGDVFSMENKAKQGSLGPQTGKTPLAGFGFTVQRPTGTNRERRKS